MPMTVTHRLVSQRGCRSSRRWLRTLAALTGLSLWLEICAAQPKPGQFGVTLGQKLQAERPALIDLASVSTLAWDELFIFDPRSTKDDNCRLLKLDYFECFTTFPATVRDDEHILVFRRNGKLVRVERHPRKNGDFVSAAQPRPQPILRTAAIFATLPGPDKSGFRLEYRR
jgi:hypothetical protein